MKLLILALLFTPVASAAPFSAPDYSSSFSDPVFATFWGGMRRTLHWKRHRGEMVELTPVNFKEAVPVYLSADKRKKDLYIFYPGIFGKPDGKISPSVIDLLEKRNVHVAVLQNILSPVYLSARPAGNDLDLEKSNQVNLLSAVIDRVGVAKIDKVHIVAESLGSFQVLMALTDPKAKSFDSLTLLWPPLYLDRSLERFDALIEKSLPKLAMCTLWWKWPFIAYEVIAKDRPELSESDMGCLGAWVVAEGFVNSIKTTAKLYFESKTEKVVIPTTFSEFMKTVLPEVTPLLESHDERLSVVHLLKSVDPAKVRIVSSKDDFLNVPAEWEELVKTYDVVLLPWGGHSGPLGIEAFSAEVMKR